MNTKKEYKASTIIGDARAKILSFIAFEVQNLYLLINREEPDFKNGDDYELEIDGISVSVEVDNSYLDVEERVYENRSLEKIYVTLDGFVSVEDISGEVIDSDDLSTDELAALSNVLENQYLEIVKSNTIQ